MNKNEAPATPGHSVPPVIRRNIILFALSQTFTGAGMQFAYGFGPLMVMSLTHSAALAGISVGAFGLSRFMVAYPVGRITDTFGRKPGIMLGLVLALAGGLILGTSMMVSSFALFVAGLLVLGMGMNAAQQLRVAATDMFLPHSAPRRSAMSRWARWSGSSSARSPSPTRSPSPIRSARTRSVFRGSCCPS